MTNPVSSLPNFGDIVAAEQALAGKVLRTPTLESRVLSQMTGAKVFLKFENLQFTSSFKERGAGNKIAHLAAHVSAAQKARGVIAVSAGNHAQGVAYHAGLHGMAARIVMPETTPMVKVDRTEKLGAQVILHGASLDEARAHAQQLVEHEGYSMVHPFDDPLVIAGQGTVAREMLEDSGGLDAVIVATGGGGLIGGVALACQELSPRTQVLGVQSRHYPAMYNLRQQQTVRGEAHTIAEGIAVTSPGLLTRQLVNRYVSEMFLVDESEIEHAIVLLLDVEKTVVEGAGAAGLACLLAQQERFRGQRVGLILCGGNIDPLLLSQIISRGLVQTGRLARLRIETLDRPGTLANIARLLGELHINIDAVEHEREFAHLPAGFAAIHVRCQARGHAHIDRALAALHSAGYRAERIG
jgi:threonine dehydratase